MSEKCRKIQLKMGPANLRSHANFEKKCLFFAPRRVLTPENARARRELPESVFRSQKGSFFDSFMTFRLDEKNFGPNV